MSKLTDLILDHLPFDVFTDVELSALTDTKSKASHYNQVKRALAKGELIRIRRGLYLLSKRYQRQSINPFGLAQKIYGPSYISFESALSYHGMIPEAVYSITSASSKRSREFKTPQGIFTYSQIPLRVFSEGIMRIDEEGHVFLMATPLKAFSDYVYVNHLDWHGLEPLVESLRLDKDALKINFDELEELKIVYASKRITRFLNGLRKDLG
jgi:predicted transcriptional regulator of viral defense system